MNILLQKFKDAFISVFPITIVVLVLHFTITTVETNQIGRFILGALFVIIGLTIFLFGVDIGVTAIGVKLGENITKTNKAWFVGLFGLILGFIISIAEPVLHVLANQVDDITSGGIGFWSIIIVVSIGVAIMVAIGLLRVIFNIQLRTVLLISYIVIFILALFASPEFLVISFDASGATTGALAVPFILALNMGVTSIRRKDTSDTDSFGLVALVAVGAILGVLLMSIFADVSSFGDIEKPDLSNTSIILPFLYEMKSQLFSVLISISPLLVIFIFFQIYSLKLSKKAVKKILKGLLYTTIGLILFLTGVNAGFMEVGFKIGVLLASYNDWVIVLVGFILGLVIIIAEPAVYVLTDQIEDVTSGSLPKISVIITLCIGVGVSLAISMIRILVPGMDFWHIALPGYIIALALMYFVPRLFIGMAFDSGGVASGPLIGTFIFAFAQGVAEGTAGADVLLDGFGMLATVALSPLIAIQILGYIYKRKTQKGGL